MKLQGWDTGTYFPGCKWAVGRGGSSGIKLDYNMNMIDSSQNTFYHHADGKICIVVYLFDQK